ncbi:rhodanese-like domain-containing protein [Tepidibacter aestuarii]|uniref:rhodanese-like domain-containing protein n=1 Tax=Tepidibacter aestuarii TaxID=2925782 RepID=UPI0020BE75E5|nr:rhodanese-like domain-containing protein [Tepidibacter aestuarii]CAH2212242.1 thiosulfate sulfurtransferase [Tepidibacter aestuarii]
MRKLISLLLAIISIYLLAACSDTNISTNSNDHQSIKIKQAQEFLSKEDILFVDLRSEEEYIGWPIDIERGGHIKGAIDFPQEWFSLLKNDKELSKELKRRNIITDKKLVLYTKNGEVSNDIIQRLSSLGYSDISVLEEGVQAWAKDATLPMDKMKNYELLVYPKWVQDLVDGKNPHTYDGKEYKIVELSFGKDESKYKEGHIKGAIHIDDKLNHVPGSRVLADYEFIPKEEQEKFWNRPDDKKIEETLLNLGITKDTMVILYGPNTTAASRCAAVMMYAGVEDVRILNGGIDRWNMDKMPLEQGVNNPKPVDTFGVKIPARPDVLIDLDEEMDIVNNPNSIVASIRSWPEYTGEISGYTYIGEAGDIPNSRFGYAGSDPYHMEDYRNIDNTMFNYHMIAARWADWGIVPDKKVSFHCGTGWRASETYMYALAMGWKNITIYDGGWYEWHLSKDRPRKEVGVPDDAPEIPTFNY